MAMVMTATMVKGTYLLQISWGHCGFQTERGDIGTDIEAHFWHG
jgi:hypothetical protein